VYLWLLLLMLRLPVHLRPVLRLLVLLLLLLVPPWELHWLRVE